MFYWQCILTFYLYAYMLSLKKCLLYFQFSQQVFQTNKVKYEAAPSGACKFLFSLCYLIDKNSPTCLIAGKVPRNQKFKEFLMFI